MLTELDEDVRDDVLDQLDSKEIAAAARELETDDAASLLEDLPDEERLRGPGRAAGRRSAPTSSRRWPIPRTAPAA